MTDSVWIITGAVLIAIIVVLVLGGKLGWFKLSLLGVGIDAGQNRGRASADDAKAGGSVKVETGAGGDASANRTEAGKDINVSSGSRSK